MMLSRQCFPFPPTTTQATARKPPTKRRLSTSSSSAPEDEIGDEVCEDNTPTYDDLEKENAELREEKAKLQAEAALMRTKLDAVEKECAAEREKSTFLADQLAGAKQEET
eukprot:scpid70841/ scgid25984/ 